MIVTPLKHLSAMESVLPERTSWASYLLSAPCGSASVAFAPPVMADADRSGYVPLSVLAGTSTVIVQACGSSTAWLRVIGDPTVNARSFVTASVPVNEGERAGRAGSSNPAAVTRPPPASFAAEASEYTAQLLLAFAKGYSRFYAGAFQDHYAVAQAEPWLRKVLLGEPSAPAPHINGVPGSKGDGFRMRWELDQDWYFKSFLPGIQAELEKIDSNAKDLTVAFEPASKSEMPYEGPVAGFAGAVKWNIFGASPEKWEVDMEYGICAIWGNAPCRHYVVLVTSLGKDNNARCRIYETTGSDTYGFRRKVSELLY